MQPRGSAGPSASASFEKSGLAGPGTRDQAHHIDTRFFEASPPSPLRNPVIVFDYVLSDFDNAGCTRHHASSKCGNFQFFAMHDLVDGSPTIRACEALQ